MTTRLEIDLDAFRGNVRYLSSLVRPAKTMIAVKADAYGHGMLPFARAALAAGADSLAVLEVPAALDLRTAGVTAPAFAWLHGAQTDFAAAAGARVDLGVSSILELDRIAAAATGPAAVHLKIDTGLHRNGANPEDWPTLIRAALDHAEAGKVRIAGLWSHLADASPAADAAALAEFHSAVAAARALGVPSDGPGAPLLHVAASSAGIREPEARLDLVRFGIAAYGASPFDDVDGPGLGLRGCLTLRTEIVQMDRNRAIIPVGWADGLPPVAVRNTRSGGVGQVQVNGRRAEVAAIEVDSVAFEVAGSDRVGDEVLVYGPGDRGEPTPEDWAAWGATIGDEILARASRRIPRVYLNE